MADTLLTIATATAQVPNRPAEPATDRFRQECDGIFGHIPVSLIQE
jgi:hypothetical protein